MSSKTFEDLIVWKKVKKRGNLDKARFYNIAQGSIEECRYYLILARDLGYEDTGTLKENLEEIRRLLEAYTRRVVRF